MAEQMPIAVPVMLMGIFASGMGVYRPLREAPMMEENSTQMMKAPMAKLAFCGMKTMTTSISIMPAEKRLMVFGVLSLSSSSPPAVGQQPAEEVARHGREAEHGDERAHLLVREAEGLHELRVKCGAQIWQGVAQCAQGHD